MQVEALDDGVSLTSNFLSRPACKHVLPQLHAYVQRRSVCETILGRQLRACDNLMKFCCHGGDIPLHIAKQLLIGAKPDSELT